MATFMLFAELVGDFDGNAVCNGYVYFHGKKVCLLAANDTGNYMSVYGVPDRSGFLYVAGTSEISREQNAKIEKLIEKYGGEIIPDTYAQSYIVDLPFGKNKQKLMRAIQNVVK